MTRSLRSAADQLNARTDDRLDGRNARDHDRTDDQNDSRNDRKRDRLVIGRLGAPRGIDGEMKLIPLTDFEDRFDGLNSVRIDDRDYRIEYVRPIGKGLVIRLDGVNDRDSARMLTNKLLTVDRSEAAPLGEGEYYTFDIIGLGVIDLDGERLGVVENVLKTGSNDVFVARAVDGREILIPALKRVVRSIDLATGTLTIDPTTLEEV